MVIVAVIECMFYAVSTTKEDRDYMRFLWWPYGDATKIQRNVKCAFFLFGATCSSACSISALRATVTDNVGSFSTEAIDTVLRKSYIDDFLTFVTSDDEAIRLTQELMSLCAEGG